MAAAGLLPAMGPQLEACEGWGGLTRKCRGLEVSAGLQPVVGAHPQSECSVATPLLLRNPPINRPPARAHVIWWWRRRRGGKHSIPLPALPLSQPPPGSSSLPRLSSWATPNCASFFCLCCCAGTPTWWCTTPKWLGCSRSTATWAWTRQPGGECRGPSPLATGLRAGRHMLWLAAAPRGDACRDAAAAAAAA